MDIIIKTVRYDSSNISNYEFDLPHEEDFFKTMKSALLDNPLLHNCERIRKALDKIKFDVNIIVDGDEFYPPVTEASIDYFKYFEDGNNPVSLKMHLGVYLGMSSEEFEKIFHKTGGRKLDNINQKIREDLLKVKFNQKGLFKTLYHEFVHLIDAFNVDFLYSNEKVKLLQQERDGCLFKNLMHPWNCYINRRLQNQLKWKGCYAYKRPIVNNEKGDNILKEMWKENKSYTFDELVELTRQFYK